MFALHNSDMPNNKQVDRKFNEKFNYLCITIN